jgi:hypothetical protein
MKLKPALGPFREFISVIIIQSIKKKHPELKAIE